MASPSVLFLQSQIEKELDTISNSSIEKELRDEIALLKEDIASGDPDDDDWLSTLNHFQQHPEEIEQHITTAKNDTVAYDESFFPKFFAAIKEQLTKDIIEKGNVVIIRYSEAETIHLDFHSLTPEEPIIKEIPYGYELNGEEVSLYEVGKSSISSVGLYDHPIDKKEVFMSISNEFFWSVMSLRKSRVLQSIYRKTQSHLIQNYSMGDYRFYIGDYGEGLWID
jgi:hypothetical protein